MKSDYSEKEYKMIGELSPNWKSIINNDKDSNIMPPRVLEIIAIQCFLFNKQGKAVDSLRRCLMAIQKCNPYRKTAEYDALIDL